MTYCNALKFTPFHFGLVLLNVATMALAKYSFDLLVSSQPFPLGKHYFPPENTRLGGKALRYNTAHKVNAISINDSFPCIIIFTIMLFFHNIHNHYRISLFPTRKEGRVIL